VDRAVPQRVEPVERSLFDNGLGEAGQFDALRQWAFSGSPMNMSL
jgi:hypothetical protein